MLNYIWKRCLQNVGHFSLPQYIKYAYLISDFSRNNTERFTFKQKYHVDLTYILIIMYTTLYPLFHVCSVFYIMIYRRVSNIRRTLAGNQIVDHSDVVGASPVGAAPITSSFST